MRAEILILSLCTAFQLSTTCSSSNFFDTSLMECSKCKTNQVGSADSSSCVCSKGYAKSAATRNSASFECAACTSGVPSSDSNTCQACPSSISDSECVCSAASYQFIQEFSQQASYLSTKACTSCSSINTYEGSPSYECQRCPDVNMTRNPTSFNCECNAAVYATSENKCVPLSGDIFLSYPQSDAVIVNYNKLETASKILSVSLISDTFAYFYMKAANDCEYLNDLIACQQLANLCVLQLYSLQSVACRLYKQIGVDRTNTSISDAGSKESMAWIYYERDASSVLDSERVEMLVTFDPNENNKTNELQFKLAAFYLNGTFKGYENLTDQLVLCPHSYRIGTSYRAFGTNVEVICDLDLSVYISYSETLFYELYLLDSNGTYIDIPILIKNFIDSDGSTPNKNSDQDGWKLVRRFFIYDNVSGKEGTNAYINGVKSSVLQYMRSAELVVKLVNDQDQKIFAPYLVLDYRARYTSYIENQDTTDTISFKSVYTMDTTRFWNIAQGVFIGVNILILIVTILRAYIWTKNNPSEHFRDTHTTRLALQIFWYLCGTWSFIIFWYLIGITAYWFIFYKMQYHVYALIPPSSTYSSNYLPFVIVFGFLFAFQFLWITYLIKSQTSLDIIFIDREQPQDAFRPGVDKIAAAIYRDEQNYKKYVSAWRTLLIANELAELQANRYVSIELTLLFLLFFLKGLSWEDLARSQPSFTVADSGVEMIPMNMVLRFFLTSFLFIIIAYVQLIVRKLSSTWLPTPTQNFVDVCVLSNISILILDDSLHGYYIHGITPLTKADMALEELHEGLNEERLKVSRKKSLLAPDEEDLFTFEVYLPFNIRLKYDSIIQQAKEDEAYNNKVMNYASSEKTRYKLNESFKAFFDPEIRNLRNFVFEKSSLQRVLSMPPTEMAGYNGSAFFYKDPGMGFEKVLFMGREFSLMLMDLLVFDLLDIAVGNSLVSALTTYLFSKIVSYIRYQLGENNIADKTKVNKSFII